ncbi:hypothetical protein MIMGU_mgv1a0045112mg, partial [Erythranthe guttata]
MAEREIEVIHLWCTRRSASTTLMYSFAQRDDTEVLDEPLYANYLRVTGAQRPYREELLSKMESDGDKVVKDIIFGPGQKKYRFCKHMATQRLHGLPDDLMERGKHCILIRIPSPYCDLGYDSLVSIFSDLHSRGNTPYVIDSDLLREDPKATLRGLCDDLGIPFQDEMVKWESGPKPFEGVWRPLL